MTPNGRFVSPAECREMRRLRETTSYTLKTIGHSVGDGKPYHPNTVDWHVHKRCTHGETSGENGSQHGNSYSREEVDAWLRRAAVEVGEPMSMSAYTDWREDHPEAPGADTIYQRADWSEALLRNDIQPARNQ